MYKQGMISFVLLAAVLAGVVLASGPQDKDGVYACQGNEVCWRIYKYMLCLEGKCKLPPLCPEDGKCVDSSCDDGHCVQDALYTKDESVNENHKENSPCNADKDCELQYCDLTSPNKLLDVENKGLCKTADLCLDDSECSGGQKCKFSECANP